MPVTITDKSIDEEEYVRFRMNREKISAENQYLLKISVSMRAYTWKSENWQSISEKQYKFMEVFNSARGKLCVNYCGCSCGRTK